MTRIKNEEAIMNQTVVTQKQVNMLNSEYAEYISDLQRNWRSEHRFESNNVYETLTSDERNKLKGYISAWERYITPLAEVWWKERGFGVVWPENNSDSMQVYPLEAV